MIFRAKRNTGGRHAAQRAPVAPQDAPVAPVPAPPVTLGGGARLTIAEPSLAPGPAFMFGPAFTGLRILAGEETAAVIALGGGCEAEITRALWLDDLAAAARVARDALTRDVREHRAGSRLIGVEPKTGPSPLTEKVQREQIAAYRHATGIDPEASEDDGQNCPACWHLWTLHDAGGCDAKVYPAHSLDGEPCPCEHTAPTAEERM